MREVNSMKPLRTPLDIDKHKLPDFRIYIIVDRCKGCGFCVEYCPKKVLEMSDEFNVKGYHPPIPVHEDQCVGCDLCELICPEFAIYVLRDEEEPEDKVRMNVEKVMEKSENKNQQEEESNKKTKT